MKHYSKRFSRRNFFPLLFWLCLTLLPIAATLGFSAQDAQTSGALSMKVLNWLLSRFPRLAAFASVAQLHRLIRKLAHFSLYFILGCGLRGLLSYQRRVPVIPAVIVAGAAYAATDEFHQRFTAGRYGSPLDVAIDTCGVIAGCTLLSVLFLLTRKRRSALRKAFWLSVTLLVTLAIILSSSLTAARVGTLSLRGFQWLLTRFPSLSPLLDGRNYAQILRFALYFLLGCGLRGLFSCQWRVPAVPATLVVGAAYAALDEFRQRVAQGRYASVTDVLTDIFGVALGCALISALFALFPRRS